MIQTAHCTTCGSAVPASFAKRSHLCPTCLILAARNPCALAKRSADSDALATRWSDAFPQFAVEKTLRDEGDLQVWEARDLDRSHRPVVLQVVSGNALEAAGGSAALLARANRLRDLPFPGLARVLDAGDLADAFFLITNRDAAWLPARTQLDPRDEDGFAERLSEAAGILAVVRNAGITTGFDLRTAYLDPATDQLVLTPSALPPAPEDELANLQATCPAFVPATGITLDGYRFEESIGEGGFGEVWRASQDRPVKRQVALKILKRGLASPRLLARFEVEQQALARLDHPNIARFFDGDTTPDDRPYFAMEWIDGESITCHCDAHKASLAERLRLFREVCEAVQHAHQKGIIHRDLKASNVMVAGVNDSPAVKVIDFGIARALEEPLSDQTLLTRAEEVLGTPATMSPEQARGAELDARTDVYGLGILLYELLTRTLPFNPALPSDELRRKIREDDPPRPSSRAETQRDRHALRGELDWITMRCLEKDPARRYRSVSALLRDLERHANHEPVEAGPPELSYRVKKFVRRNKMGVAAAAAVLLALLGGLLLASLGLSKARQEAWNALAAERKTEATLTDTRVANGLLNAELGKPAEAALWLAYAAARGQDPERAILNKRRFTEWMRMADVPIAAVQVGTPWRWAYDLRFSPRDELLRIASFHGENDEVLKEVRLLPIDDPERFAAVGNRSWRAADFHPTKPWIALIHPEGELLIFDWILGEMTFRWNAFEATLAEVAFSRDGKHLALAGRPARSDSSFAVTVLPVERLHTSPRWEPLSDFPRYLEWSPEDRFLLAGAGMEAVHLFQVDAVNGNLESRLDEPLNDTRSLTRTASFPAMKRPLFSADGASFYLGRYARQFDLETGGLLQAHPKVYNNPIRATALAPNLDEEGPEELFYASQGPRILALNQPDREKSHEYKFGHAGFVYSFETAPDGSSLLVGGNGGDVFLCSREPGREDERRALGVHDGTTAAVAFSERGDLVATVQTDRIVRVWRRALASEASDFYFPVAWIAPADQENWKGWNYRSREQIAGFSPATAWGPTHPLVNMDASLLVPIPQSAPSTSMNATASWTLPDGEMQAVGFSTGAGIMAGAFSPVDPNLLLTGHYAENDEGALMRWNATTGEEIGKRVPLPAHPRGVAISPDGQRMATVCAWGEVFVADLNDPDPKLHQLAARSDYAELWGKIHTGRIAYSPDGRFLLTWGMHGVLRCYEAEGGQLLYQYKPPSGMSDHQCLQVVFGADGLLCTSWDRPRQVIWINLATGEPESLPTLEHPAAVHDVLLSGDRSQLITACGDGVMRVWNCRTGEVLRSFDYGEAVFAASWTEEGFVVAGAGSGESGFLQVWDPRTALPVSPKWWIGNVRSVKVIRRDRREFVLAGVAEGGVFGYDLGKHLAQEQLSATQCLRLGEVISGRKILPTGTVTRMTATEWLQQWESLGESERRFLAECHRTNEASWHRRMSDRPEAKPIRDWHRERLRALDPKVASEFDLVEDRRAEAASLQARRKEAQEVFKLGNLAGTEGQWAEARRHFEAGVELLGGEVSPVDLGTLSLVLAKLGDAEACFNAGRKYVERVRESKDPFTLRMGARLYFALPGAPDPEVAQEARELARRAVEGAVPDSSDYQFGALALGLAHLRLGEWREAEKWLEVAAGAGDDLPYCRIPAWSYGAVAARRSQRHQAAAEALQKAEAELARLSGPTADSWIGHTWAELALQEARSALSR